MDKLSFEALTSRGALNASAYTMLATGVLVFFLLMTGEKAYYGR